MVNASQKDRDSIAVPGAFGCTHWIEPGSGVLFSCDLSPDEHKTNQAGYTIHTTAITGGYKVGYDIALGTVVVSEDKGCEISWTDASDVR